MANIKFDPDMSIEELKAACEERTDRLWLHADPTASVYIELGSHVYVKHGVRVNLDRYASLSIRKGCLLFVLGDFEAGPRTKTEAYMNGVLVIGPGSMDMGSFVSCTMKLWIADTSIGPHCFVTDSNAHHVYDRDGKEHEFAKPTVLRGHVCLDFGAAVLKGSDIGYGCVIGPRSLVTGTIPAGCYVEGNPAKVVHEGITWEPWK